MLGEVLLLCPVVPGSCAECRHRCDRGAALYDEEAAAIMVSGRTADV